ncbi:hypothetical protein ACFO9Q_00260 [Paenibacillus sp. GCM10023252]|uniref:hypothetical protein n=1 Tax=Paenibacillus sp. GCM10023252 TaxID=3252649 RepID=UPI00361DC345
MRKSMLWSVVGAGAAYLLRNKDARQKLMNQFQKFSSKGRTSHSVDSMSKPL